LQIVMFSRERLPGPLAALHSPLPHSIYIGAQLIRINAGTFGGKMVMRRSAQVWKFGAQNFASGGR
jgi:hypothetical protein